MDKETFEQRLVQASERAISWAREHVWNILPEPYLYLLIPNQSYDGNPLKGDEEIFPNETLPPFKFQGPWDFEQTMAFLWRNGKVPEWVDISVRACGKNFSYLQLRCCGRFTATEELLYHRAEDCQPFHIQGPNIPPGWEGLEQSGKFNLHWHGHNLLDDQ